MTKKYLESMTVCDARVGEIDNVRCYRVASNAPEAMRRMVQFYAEPIGPTDFTSHTYVALRDVDATLAAHAAWVTPQPQPQPQP